MKLSFPRSFMLLAAVAGISMMPLSACSTQGRADSESQTGDISVSSSLSGTDESSAAGNTAGQVLDTLKGISFTYKGSTGNWETKITFGTGGNFTGTYTDTEKSMTGKKYSKGTVYTSSFSGRFSEAPGSDSLTYQLTLEELTLDEATGTETIKKKVRYITTNAYGLSQGDVFTLYMAGYESSSLPEEFRDIITSSRELYDGLPSNISFCGLYNPVTRAGFTSDNYLDTQADNANAAYLNILTYYQADIERYNWEYSAHTRPTALCDIDGDGIDELFFFTSETDSGPGILHIYTYADGNAEEVSYPFDSIDDGSDSSLMFKDLSTGTGTSYVIFKDKNEDALWIYRRGGENEIDFMLYKYSLDENGKLKEEYTLKKTGNSENSVSSVSLAMPLLGEYYDGTYDDGSGDGSYDYDDGSYDDGSGDGSYNDGSYDNGSGDDSYDDGSYDDGSYDDYSGDYSYDYDYGSYTSVNGVSSTGGTFEENGKTISGSEGAQAFSDGFDNIGTVLLTSTETNDAGIWSRFTNDDVKALSWDDMCRQLAGT